MKRRSRLVRPISTPLFAVAGLLMLSAVPLRAGNDSDAPKTDAPKVAAPKTDAPKTDVPKTDAPKTSAKLAAEPKRIKQNEKGTVVLQARDVVIHGTTVRYEPDKNTIGYWSKQPDWVSWELEITKPDTFSVQMLLGCGAGSGGSHFTVEIADQKIEDKVPDTGSFHTFHLRKAGEVTIDKPGNYTLSVRAQDKPGVAVMDLRTVTLLPVKLEKKAKDAADQPLFQIPDGGNPTSATPDNSKPGDAKPAGKTPAKS